MSDDLWRVLDGYGLGRVRKMRANHEFSPQNFQAVDLWIEQQESASAATDRASTVALAREANTLAREANAFAEQANSTADRAAASVDVAAERAKSANALAAKSNALAAEANSLAALALKKMHKANTIALIALIAAIATLILSITVAYENWK